MKKSKILGYSIITVLFILGIFCICNSKVYAAENYTQEYYGYSASYSNYVENKTEDTSKLGTVDVTITFEKKISNNANIPTNWTKVNDTTLKSTRSQAEFSNFSLTMQDNTKTNVYIMTPFEIKKGERIKDITLGKYFPNASREASLNVTSDNSNVLKVTETSGSFTIEAVGKGSATLTGTVSSNGDALGGELTTKGFVYEEEKQTGIEAWNITLNKNKTNIEVGNTDEIIVNAELKSGYSAIQAEEKIFDVTWKVKDETILKCTSEKGEKISNKGKISSAEIEGLKEGNTVLTITVKEKGNESQSVEFEVPITVTAKEVEKEDDGKEDKKDESKQDDGKEDKKDESKQDDDKEDKKDESKQDDGKEDSKDGSKQDESSKDVKDNTQSDKPIIQAGENHMIVVLIAIGIAVSIISIIKMKKIM